LKELEAVAQPLHDGAADEDAAFERELAPAVCAHEVEIRPLCERITLSPVCSSMKQPVP
jgi:hypothetical protein